MTNVRNGPPGIEVGPRPGNHPRTEDTDTNTISSHDTADNNIIGDARCRCAYGEPVCVCDFYAGWTCDWNFPQDTPTQLKRRSAAALRTVPQPHSGRRDPISARLGRWAA